MKKLAATLLLVMLTMAPFGKLAPLHAALAEQREMITLSFPPVGWPPYIISDLNNTGPGGILIEVFREICRVEGYELQMVTYPEKRGRIMLQEGRVNAISKAKEWVEDPSIYLWTDPIVDSANVVISRQTNPIQFTSPQDLAGLNVGLVFSFYYPKLGPLISRGVIIEHRANNSQNLLRMLNHGHLDCAIINPLVARWQMRTQTDLSPDDFVFSKTPLDNAPCRFAFTPGERWKPFIARFNKQLAKMKGDGRLDAILARYR